MSDTERQVGTERRAAGARGARIELTRRAVLGAPGAGLVVLLAGCLADTDGALERREPSEANGDASTDADTGGEAEDGEGDPGDEYGDDSERPYVAATSWPEPPLVAGERIPFTFEVENPLDIEESVTVTIRESPDVVDLASETVTIGPESSAPITVSLVFEDPGSYDLETVLESRHAFELVETWSVVIEERAEGDIE